MTWKVLLAVLVGQVAVGLPRPTGPNRTVSGMPERLRALLQPKHRTRTGPLAGFEGEFMIDTSVGLLPSSADEWYPDAATDGANWLVVWTSNGSIIQGTRFSGAGAPVDTAPVRISPDSAYSDLAHTAFNGTDYVVTWFERNSGQIQAARVTPSGELRDTVPIVVGSSYGGGGAVAALGETCLVAWTNYGASSNDIYAARLTADGTVLDPGGFLVSDDTTEEYGPAVAAGTSGFLLAWTANRYDTINYDMDVVAARVGITGQVIDTTPIQVAATPGWRHGGPTVAFAVDRYLVAWVRDSSYDFVPAVECRRLTAEGVIMDTAVIPLPPTQGTPSDQSVAADTSGFLVAWCATDTLAYEGAVRCSRISLQGRVLDTLPLVLSDSGHAAYGPRVSSGPGAFLGVWPDRVMTSSDIRAARVSPHGTVLETLAVLLTCGPDEQACPRVAACSTNALAAWLEMRSQGYALHAGRVSAAGTLLDPSGFQVSAGPCYTFPPGIAYGAGKYLVAWTNLGSDRPGAYAARVTPDGTVLDTSGIPVCTTGLAPLAPNVAFDGTNFLLTWSAVDTMGMTSNILGARVTPAGTVLDPEPLVLANEDPTNVTSSAVFNGQSYVVAWTSSSGTEYDLKFKRLRPDGVLLDTTARILSSATGEQMWPWGASSGETSMFVWMDYRSGMDLDIYGARVMPDGSVLDPDGRLISTSGPDEIYPSVVWNGRNYFAFWDEVNYDSTFVAGARLGPDCSVLERFRVTALSNTYQVFIAAAAFPAGELLVTWDDYAGEYLGRMYDCRRVWGKMGPFGGIAEQRPSAVPRPPCATVVRGVLRLGKRGQSTTGQSLVFLVDATGRKVLDLKPGPNDVRALPAGVYFIWGLPVVGRRQAAVQKVVVQR
ncbi:hypothetical protein FJY71_01035 [candidate division WOR-3 bacterium]|nr:hypothetical protein [candidate division WOR-3 bacterium]